MKRIPEKELMEGTEQALAYARADFDEPHNKYIELFRDHFPDSSIDGSVLDLGCGPCDITIRFALAFPEARIDAIDGSAAMLVHAKQAIRKNALEQRIKLFHEILPCTGIDKKYDVIISNSLLHHLSCPDDLWETMLRLSRSGTLCFIMDLTRPQSRNRAKALVEKYAKQETQILKDDFFNSLLAAYTDEEIEQMLDQKAFHNFSVLNSGDRHMIIFGKM